MGRLQPSARLSFQDTLNAIRTEYRERLQDENRRKAFDKQVEAWSSELGAISYAESITLKDLLLLTSAVDNRAFTEALKVRLDALEDKIKSISEDR